MTSVIQLFSVDTFNDDNHEDVDDTAYIVLGFSWPMKHLRMPRLWIHLIPLHGLDR